MKVRTKEGEICHFVKIIKMGGIKFKVEDKAIKMNVEGKEKNMEGKEKNLEGEEVKLPDYEPWEVREAKVEEENKELRNIMYLRKRRLEKEADPEKSIKLWVLWSQNGANGQNGQNGNSRHSWLLPV